MWTVAVLVGAYAPSCFVADLLSPRITVPACPAGTFSADQASSCSACPANSTSVAGSSTCACDAGYFGTGSGASLTCTRTLILTISLLNTPSSSRDAHWTLTLTVALL